MVACRVRDPDLDGDGREEAIDSSPSEPCSGHEVDSVVAAGERPTLEQRVDVPIRIGALCAHEDPPGCLKTMALHEHVVRGHAGRHVEYLRREPW